MPEKTTNPNYEETAEGWQRKPDAPDAKHTSRIDWHGGDSLRNAREGVSDLRQKQDERNEEYKRKHGG